MTTEYTGCLLCGYCGQAFAISGLAVSDAGEGRRPTRSTLVSGLFRFEPVALETAGR